MDGLGSNLEQAETVLAASVLNQREMLVDRCRRQRDADAVRKLVITYRLAHCVLPSHQFGLNRHDVRVERETSAADAVSSRWRRLDQP